MDGKKKPAKKRANGKARKPVRVRNVNFVDPVTRKSTPTSMIDLRGQGEVRELSVSEVMDLFVEGARAMLARGPKDKSQESYLQCAKRYAERVIVRRDEAEAFLKSEETRQALEVGICLAIAYSSMGGFMMQEQVDKLRERLVASKRGGHQRRAKSMAEHEELDRVILDVWNGAECPKSMKVLISEVAKSLRDKYARSGKKPGCGKTLIYERIAELENRGDFRR
ncbi:MAG: hypothetical protein IT365_11210 [Candidatus Hydrogenedentes bacterium]|nr:hypothetical protein [Candidatus Hydrogenedentota bacterium]